eukprot:21973-Pyramimonas_sp.AAC.1
MAAGHLRSAHTWLVKAQDVMREWGPEDHVDLRRQVQECSQKMETAASVFESAGSDPLGTNRVIAAFGGVVDASTSAEAESAIRIESD